MKYKVQVANFVAGPFETFFEAFKVFNEEFLKMVKEGTSVQVVETFCWIEDIDAGVPIAAYDAIDAAIELGIINKKGELISENPPEIQRMNEVLFRYHQKAQEETMGDLSTFLDLLSDYHIESLVANLPKKEGE